MTLLKTQLRNFFLLLLLTFYSCGSDLPELNQMIKQEGLQVKTPSFWSFEKTPFPGNTGYTLDFYDEKEETTLSIVVVDLPFSLEEVYSISEEILEKNQVINNLEKSTVIDGTFKNWESKEVYFIGQILDDSETVKGKSISFTNGSKSYIINYLGNIHYDQNRLVQKILSTFELTPDLEVKGEDTISKQGFNKYTIADIAEIEIPLTLELRDKDAYISLKATYIRKKFREQGRPLEKSAIVFQTTGTNKASEGEFAEYGRILIDYEFGEPGSFYKWNEDLILSTDMEQSFSQSLKEEITTPMSQLNIKLIEWFPLEYRKKNEKGLSYFKTSYLRQMGSNPIIRTERYNFFNDSEAVTITLSYRVNESPIWASDFQEVINSFNFINRYN